MNYNMSSLQDTLESGLSQMISMISTYVPSLLAALAILIIGWLVALAVSALVAGILKKTNLSHVIAQSVHSTDKDAEKAVTSTVKSIVFYVIMLFVLIGFFQALKLPLITEPLNNMLQQIFIYIPQIFAAAAILLIGWLLATAARSGLTTLFSKTSIDEKLAAKTGGNVSVADSISNTVYWIILFFTLPLVLDALELKEFLMPVNNMFSELLGHLPNIFSAIVIFTIGFFLAKIIKQVVTNLLASAGANSLLEKAGMGQVLGEQKLSDILGMVVYVLILFPVLIQSLEALQLDAIVQPATGVLNQIFDIIPGLFAALIIVGIAVFIGKIASTLVEGLLKSVGFDKVVGYIGIGEVSKDKAPSAIVAKVINFAIILFASMEAFQVLGLDAISEIINRFILFGGQILMGVVILIVGLMIANFAENAIKGSGANNSGFLATFAKVGIMVLAIAMGLQEMGIASEIINLAFGLLLGAVAVAIAIAFGIGGKDIAAQKTKEFFDNIK
jgi:hypothetical protein